MNIDKNMAKAECVCALMASTLIQAKIHIWEVFLRSPWCELALNARATSLTSWPNDLSSRLVSDWFPLISEQLNPS